MIQNRGKQSIYFGIKRKKNTSMYCVYAMLKTDFSICILGQGIAMPTAFPFSNLGGYLHLQMFPSVWS